MAKMLPTGYDENTTPPGEKIVFGWLREYGPADWTVLHQLDLAPWNKGRKTEIDFLVIMPRQGLFAVEVKSHEQIRYDVEGWHLNFALHHRGPFKQADDGRKTLERRLREYLPSMGHVPICRLVMFPCATFSAVDNAEYRAYELFDRSRLLTALSDDTLIPQLIEAHITSVKADGSLQPVSPDGLSSTQVESLLAFLRPVQCRHETAKQARVIRRQELDAALRQQQKQIISLAENNQRLIVKGGAGTGKTYIAMELAKRSAEDGIRTALFCFNRPVGKWMDAYMHPRQPNLIVGPFLQTLSELCGATALGSAELSPDDEAGASLIEDHCRHPVNSETIGFDRVIVDEAQDILCRPWLLKCLDAVLRGGTVGGRWVLLGDTDFQVLGSETHRGNLRDVLRNLGPIGNPAIARLDENCRNFGIVGNAALAMAGIDDPVYDGFRRGLGPDASLRQKIYDTDEKQLSLLADEVAYWLEQGIQSHEIAILTTELGHAKGVANQLDAGFKLRGAGEPGYAMVSATVSEFKGLEAQAVIVTDVDLIDKDTAAQRRDLFYTAVTRATYGVSILMTERSAKQLVGR